MILSIVLVLGAVCSIAEPAKILYVLPFGGPSHYIALKDLGLELANRGHEVHVITPFRENNPPPNYHQIMVQKKSPWEFLSQERPNIFTFTEYSFSKYMGLLYQIGYMLNELVFESDEFLKFMQEDHKFDVVINELFYQEPFYLLAHKYQAPLVLVSTFGNSMKTNFYGKNPLQLNVANHEWAVFDPTGVVGRFWNVYCSLYDLFMHKFVYMPKQEEYARKYFKDLPQPVPSLEELAGNASLVLMNSHFSIDNPTAYLPNFVEVGGLNHVKKPKALPKDLQEILDKATNGVVFMSLGSNVQSTDLSKDKLEAFIKVFGELKETVLMKWEDDTLTNIPKNVILRKWFPQIEVVAHPNVKLFIGHGGLISLLETINAGVPILGIPVFADQYLNIHSTIQNGNGAMLEHKNINEHNLRTILNKMLTDKRYKEKALEISTRFKDRPMNGLDTAIWWIEYVIRHKGADFIKTPALKFNFLQYYMLDVLLLVLAVALAPLLVVWKIVGLFKSKPVKKNVEKKKQKRN
ncbi:hypothetical protein JYU34_005938 [Plutella xylostella]|uniref:UDP-glucuronosyltransferase n=1 Tax=Plutella xylostella TaxID=51655 RepID=A0ABQ7QUK8_PLUXY|nr:hypothetical protein JYU34_005938 [Plutella xylostella]